MYHSSLKNIFAKIAESLCSSGVEKVSISLLCDNPKDYNDIMQPKNGLGFQDVCTFVTVCAEIGKWLIEALVVMWNN